MAAALLRGGALMRSSTSQYASKGARQWTKRTASQLISGSSLPYTLLEGYNLIAEIPVAWRDMDAYQHVNNAMYLTYIESARIQYLEKMIELGTPLDFLKGTSVGPILADMSIKYKFPVTYPDTVLVGARVTAYSDEYSFIQEYKVVSGNKKRIAAEARGRVVCMDYRTGKKAAVPEDVALSVQRIDGLSYHFIRHKN